MCTFASEVAQSCPTLCNPIDCSPPGPSVHGILQARTLEWVAISFSKRNYREKESEVAQLCLTLGNPMDRSLPGSPIHGIYQARVLEWVGISFSSILYTSVYINTGISIFFSENILDFWVCWVLC